MTYVLYVRKILTYTEYFTVTALAQYAAFDTAWQASAYLADYYTAVEDDERVTMRFLAAAAHRIGELPRLLEFGCGPTVHHLLAFAPMAREIHVADYLPANLEDVRAWVEGRRGAHDWTAFVDYALQVETGRTPSIAETTARERLTRARITRYIEADARCPRPLPSMPGRPRYPAVVSCFCPDSITDDRAEWRRCMLHIASLVDDGGWLVLAALRGADHYRVGGLCYPSASLSEDDIALALDEAGMSAAETSIVSADVDDRSGHGFNGVILALSRRLSS